MSSVKNSTVLLYTCASIGCSKPGFTHSRYQLQKSSHISEYIVFNASLNLNCCIMFSTSCFTSFSLFSNQRVAKSLSVLIDCPFPLGAILASHIFTSFSAFQILLLKLRPCSSAA